MGDGLCYRITHSFDFRFLPPDEKAIKKALASRQELFLIQISVYRGVNAKDFFVKKSSALPKNFEKGLFYKSFRPPFSKGGEVEGFPESEFTSFWGFP